MINIKQLKYFITCADAGSFSEAASVLYTTQSSVSKVIRALEEEMQASLFTRNPHGISLTPHGKQAYAYASRVLENVEAMTELSATGDTPWLNISFNPSSWMADCFVRFYQLHEKENLHCQAHTGKMREVLERIREYKDELGFLYVTSRQQTDLQYQLVRKQLEFVPLKELDTFLYPGRGNMEKEGKQLTQEAIENLHYIQNFLEDAGNYEGWKLETENNLTLGKIDVSVVTNSDYIMEKMLDHGNLANISGNSLTPGKTPSRPGICLTNECSKIIFGYVKREKTSLSDLAEEFLAYVKQELIG
jgi:DNA-binding transcriptional LysR family regulator